MSTNVSESSYRIWDIYVLLFAISGNPKIHISNFFNRNIGKFKENSKKREKTSYVQTDMLSIGGDLTTFFASRTTKNGGEPLRLETRTSEKKTKSIAAKNSI